MNSRLVHPILLTLVLSRSFSQIARVVPPQTGRGSTEGPRHRSHRTDLKSQADKVDALFAPWSQNQMPGAAVLVVQGGQVVHKKGYGLADIKSKTPIRPDTSFLLGSATKSFTALSIMILADRRELSYDDSLLRFFPRFPRYAREITIRNLLHHTAGLAEYDDLFRSAGKIDGNWPRSIRSMPSPFEPTSRQTLHLLAAPEKLKFYPGEDYRYSNSGYVVLAQIVEKVSGRRFRKFVDREIFQPRGMENSPVYDETQPKVEKRASSYSWKEGKYRNVDYTPLNFIYGEDGIYTTLDDMVRWIKTIDEQKLVKPKTWQEAFTPGQLNNGKFTDYGFGWFVEADYVWHNGEWLGFRSYIAHHPKAGLNVVVLSNCKELNASSLGAEVAEIYQGDHHGD
jgi:CubicO group peptidase (beta-lactamase class C family)